jgi:hypothetical protein
MQIRVEEEGKHTGMIDIIEEANKHNSNKQNIQSSEKTKKKVRDANEMFGVDNFLNKIENEQNY